MNRVQLEGFTGADAELKYLPYVRGRLKSGAFLTLEAVPHNEEDEEE